MTELFQSNRWIWQSETFWNCYSRRNGRLFQENLLLKATNTKVVAPYYMNYIRGMQRLPRVVRADAGTENVITRKLQMFFEDSILMKCRGKKVSHWNVRFEPNDRNVVWRVFFKLLRIFGEICFNICVIVFLSMTQMYILYTAFGFNTTATRFVYGYVQLSQDKIAKTFGGPLWNSWCAILSTADV